MLLALSLKFNFCNSWYSWYSWNSRTIQRLPSLRRRGGSRFGLMGLFSLPTHEINGAETVVGLQKTSPENTPSAVAVNNGSPPYEGGVAAALG